MKRNITVLLGGLVVIAVVLWAIQKAGTDTSPQSTQTQTNTSGESNTSHMRIGSSAIYVAEQRPGSALHISIVSLAAPGYVIIHESINGEPGAVIGQSQLISDTSAEDFVVPLTRSVSDGEELIAMLYAENEGVGFDASTDGPVLDTRGNPYYMIFGVSADAPDPKESAVVF